LDGSGFAPAFVSAILVTGAGVACDVIPGLGFTRRRKDEH
jgi:hypothetical protein